MSDETPEDKDVWCDSCEEGEASCTLSITNSQSMDNLSYACDECAYQVVTDWMAGGYSDIEGWEIKRL